MDSTPMTAPQGMMPAPTAEPTGIASNITASDLRLPRVALLQALSPLVQEDPEKYRQGQFVNSLTQDIITDPVLFTPVFVFKNAIKYRTREEGGGIIYKTVNFTPEVIKDISWDGTNKPVATQFINVVALVAGQDIPLIISFANTSFKSGQDLLTLIQLSGQAWKYQYQLVSFKTKNDKGMFYIMRIKRGAPSTADAIVEAASLYGSVKDMSIDTDFESSHSEEHQSTGATPTEF